MRAHCRFCDWESGPIKSFEVCAHARQHLREKHREHLDALLKHEQDIEEQMAALERCYGDAVWPT